MKATSTVIVNPYDKNKLSALIKIDYYQPVRFNYTVHGKSSNGDFYYASARYADALRGTRRGTNLCFHDLH
ncbi:aryl-sulfate sulfotransferase N-terminal domain-containing protein [Enterobacter hormaechei]|uniref:aryl-sulfate sulfotransferase N-terminal domain-containing protein n=1 Tax=Enterobacter hormaechei TaxID=158836 RepID=UPI002416AD4F|nr:aryl-sulfate sulfotransferase N-terminal domain-containing protein [Enterobacter hormaechei]WFP29458.1 aryl-sulfate sulfotransferase N-terminal domain-containing protein [Enterobacter hormaechei subsp. xiangfangensis]